jgi:uncharacterized protein YbcV (DUF1398 family)
MIYREMISVYSGSNTKLLNKFCSQNAELYNVNSFYHEMHLNNIHYFTEAPRIYIAKTDRLVLFRLIITVHSENNTKHINTLCGQNKEVENSFPTEGKHNDSSLQKPVI